jgi:hypothetical protein
MLEEETIARWVQQQTYFMPANGREKIQADA